MAIRTFHSGKIFLATLLISLSTFFSALAQSEIKQTMHSKRIFQFSDIGYSVSLTHAALAEGEILYELRISGLAAFPLHYQSFQNPDRLHVEIKRFRVPRVHEAKPPKESGVEQIRISDKENTTHVDIIFRDVAQVLSTDGAREGTDAIVRMIRKSTMSDNALLPQHQANKEESPEQDLSEDQVMEEGEEEREEKEEEISLPKSEEELGADMLASNSEPPVEPLFMEVPADLGLPSQETGEPRDNSKPQPIIATQFEEYYVKRFETEKVFVENQYGKPLRLEARVGRLMFPGTEHENMEIDVEVQVKPKSKTLGKGKKQSFDLLYMGSPGFQEKAFQLEIKAFSTGKSKKSLGVLRVPLFSMPEKPRPDVQWQREENTLGLKNLGNVSVMLRNGKICLDSLRCEELGPIRIYPGNKIGIQVPKTAWAEFLVAYQQGTTKLQVPVYTSK